MTITFESLKSSHFAFLLKWLETPHVKAWWDQDITWTPELIQEKYRPRVDNKKISGYIIYFEDLPIGFIQIYNLYDFPRSKPFENIPDNCAGFDVFIGEEKYIHRGIGAKAIALFLEKFCDPVYDYAFTDPDLDNIAAIKAYEKAGFKKISEHLDTHEVWMLRRSTKK